MTSPDNRHADAALRADCLRLLADMLDALTSGRARRWQLASIAPSLRVIHHVLTQPALSAQARRQAEKETVEP